MRWQLLADSSNAAVPRVRRFRMGIMEMELRGFPGTDRQEPPRVAAGIKKPAGPQGPDRLLSTVK
ncbi:hypothetical protein GCM10023185_39040 [Hymenobacter saemangeumensis]|uniref:Uncharacterized protein n=1 Tax=Hymenobacter saemangeumensis TaxID=1084522 RepID=A0ABP8IQN7_9BACT